MIEITETKKAYIAGLFDGEGCIHIRRNRPSSKTKHKSTMYSLILKLAMCHKETIEYVHATLGVGYISQVKKEGEKSQAAWAWYCSSGDAIKVLEVIAPFMLTKLEQAKIAFEFSELGHAKRGQRKVSAELQGRREAMYWRMRDAKPRKGTRGVGGAKKALL